MNADHLIHYANGYSRALQAINGMCKSARFKFDKPVPQDNGLVRYFQVPNRDIPAEAFDAKVPEEAKQFDSAIAAAEARKDYKTADRLRQEKREFLARPEYGYSVPVYNERLKDIDQAILDADKSQVYHGDKAEGLSWLRHPFKRWSHGHESSKAERLAEKLRAERAGIVHPYAALHDDIAREMAWKAYGGGLTYEQMQKYIEQHPEARFLKAPMQAAPSFTDRRHMFSRLLPDNHFELATRPYRPSKPKRQLPWYLQGTPERAETPARSPQTQYQLDLIMRGNSNPEPSRPKYLYRFW